MSIHEVVYNHKGRVIKSKCIDREIEAVREGAVRVGDMIARSDKFPAHSEARGVNPNQSTDNPKHPTLIRTLTAQSVDLVSESEIILGFTTNGDFVKMPVFERVYYKEEINDARLRVVNVGFVYSETEIYVAAPKPTFASRIRTLIGI